MVLFKYMAQKLKRVHSVSTPFGGIGWDNHHPISVPEFSATFTIGYSQSKKGRNTDELLCIWTGKLRLINSSPHNALKVTIQPDTSVGIDIQCPPVFLQAGILSTLDVQCRRYFDCKEIYPSRYQLPLDQPQHLDINPLLDRCPSGFLGLEVILFYSNTAGVRFKQFLHREDGAEDMIAEQPIEQKKEKCEKA